jgi:hypothetical protein
MAELTARVQRLDALADATDPVTAREALRSYLKGGTIVCSPEAGAYVARAELLPLAVMLDGPNAETPSELEPGRAGSTSGCAGRI